MIQKLSLCGSLCIPIVEYTSPSCLIKCRNQFECWSSLGSYLLMVYKLTKKLFFWKHIQTNRNGAYHLNSKSYHSDKEFNHELLPSEWYEKAFLKVRKLTHLFDQTSCDSTVLGSRIEQKKLAFKSLARFLVGSPSTQQRLKEIGAIFSFGNPSERDPMVVDSLTKVSNFLNISAQQRKVVRLSICSHVTQHRIWAGAIGELLAALKNELGLLNNLTPRKGIQMGQQIVSSCLKVLDEKSVCGDLDSASWMRLSPSKLADSSPPNTWEDILEMFNDLSQCLKNEEESLRHFAKIEVMREGLSQIKDIVIDKNMGYKESQLQESLVQKKLSKTLGHSSKCLFTLLLYYLYGSIADLEIDMCGGLCNDGGNDRFRLCMGNILTCTEERVIWNGVKQLDRALGLFKFVWESAQMKGVLELEGHLWCVGADERKLTYRDKTFFVLQFGLT